MEHIKLIDEEEYGAMEAPRVLALAEDGQLQIQIEQDYDNAYIDLYLHEVKELVAALQNWVEEKEHEPNCRKE